MAKSPERYFYPYDFMKPELGFLFVGYKAGTRINELNKDYPFLFDSKPQGKYVTRRLRKETMQDWLHKLPKDLRYAIHRSGLTTGG